MFTLVQKDKIKYQGEDLTAPNVRVFLLIVVIKYKLEVGHSSQITRRACVRAMLFLDLSTFSLGTNEYSVRAQARLYQVQFDCQYISNRQFTARTELSGKGLCSGAHPWKIKRKTERIS